MATKPIERWLRLSALAIFAAGTSAAAQVQDLGSCVGEIQRVCVGLEDHIENCVTTRGSSMTTACREQLTGAITMLEAPSGPGTCVADIKRLCPSLAADALASCMAEKTSEFSGACQEFLHKSAQK